VHQDHPFSAKCCIEVEELAHEPFVMIEREVSPHGYDHWLSICSKHGFSPDIVNYARSLETVLTLVEAGLGIAMLPNYLKAFASPVLRFLKLAKEDGNKLDIVAVWKRKSLNNPALPLFIEEINPLYINSLYKH
jgi:DNA-binding transcriptional LysR family regulator